MSKRNRAKEISRKKAILFMEHVYLLGRDYVFWWSVVYSYFLVQNEYIKMNKSTQLAKRLQSQSHATI